MNESQNQRAVVVGVFVFLGLLFLIGGILMIGNLHETFKKKSRLMARFDNVNGLQVGSNIWFSGVKVGIVSGIKFYGRRQVEVVLKVQDKVLSNIRKDAFVRLSTDGLIGNKILVIYGGTKEARFMMEDDTLSVEKTFTSEDMINTLQESNKNILAISSDFKNISANLLNGNGAIGKLLTDDAMYTQLNAASLSLQKASAKAEQLLGSLNTFSQGLNKKGTLAHELTNDTVVFSSIKLSVLQFKKMADTATVFVNDLKVAGSNPKTTIGILLHDEEAGTHVKQTIKTLDSAMLKLDVGLEAAQHSIFLRGYFKKKNKKKK